MEIPQADPHYARWKDLGVRIKGVVPLLIALILAVTYGGILFSALILLAAIIMLREWDSMTKNEKKAIKLAGYPLTIFPCSCLIWLRSLDTETDPHYGMKLVFTLICLIAATDIGAYFIGKRFGKHKLAPLISPNKTWEGLGGGMAFSMLLSLFALSYTLSLSLIFIAGIGIITAILAQTGDIMESFLKRRAGLKDSGNLIPGHGGLLDRVDGYLLTAPAFALLVYLSGTR